jgi:hypothetical protein
MAAIHVAPAVPAAAAALPYADQAAFLHALGNGPVHVVVDALTLLAPQQRAEQLRLIGTKHVSTLIRKVTAAQWLAVLDGLSDDERRPLLAFDATLNAKKAYQYIKMNRRLVNSGLSAKARACIDNVRMHPAGTNAQPTFELVDASVDADLPVYAALPTGIKQTAYLSPHVFERVLVRDFIHYNANMARAGNKLIKQIAKAAVDRGAALKQKTAEEEAHVFETWCIVEPLTPRPIYAAPAYGRGWYVVPLSAMRV